MKVKNIISIQVLRGVAAMLVVFTHSSNQIKAGPLIENFKIGHFGVDLFFVISGFIMVYITYYKNISALNFFKNRVIRIVPIYWLYTSLALFIMLIFPSAFRQSVYELYHFVLSLFFIPHENPGTGSFSPFLRPGWTLNYEMYFYALFAISIYIFKKNAVIRCMIILILIFIFGQAINLITDFNISRHINYYSRSIILEFLYGMIIGLLYCRKQLPNFNKIFSFFMIFILFYLAYLSVDSLISTKFRGIGHGLLAALILLFFFNFEGELSLKKYKLLHVLGNASYSIYLSHIFVISFIRIVWIKFGIPDTKIISQIFFQILCFLSSGLVGYLSWKYIELPITKALKGN